MYSAAATGIRDRRSSSRAASFLTASGIPRRFDLLAELLDLLLLVVAFAQLLLDRLHLLAQEVVALVLADLRLHLGLDLRPELEDLELLDQDPVQAVHPGADVERVEHLLLDRRADGAQARRDEVGEAAGLLDVDGKRLQIVGEQRRQRDDLLEVALDVAQQRVDLEVVVVAQLVGSRRDLRARRYGCIATISSRRMRARPCTIRRRLPSGSLNILWMCVAVPTG